MPEPQTTPPGPGDAPRPEPPVTPRRGTARRRLLADKAARWLVSAGGMAIIASILGILLFILIEVVPLVRGARVAVDPSLTVDVADPGVVLSDEYRTYGAVLGLDGRVRVIELATGDAVLDRPLLEDPDASAWTDVRAVPGQQLMLAATADGRVLAQQVEWEVSFIEQDRRIEAKLPPVVIFDLDETGRPLGEFTVRVDGEGGATAVGQLEDGRLVVATRTVEENLFTGEVSETWERSESAAPGPLSVLLLDQERRNLYAGTADGDLLWWRLEGGSLVEAQRFRDVPAGISALSLLIGDRALVVGRQDGSVAVWFEVRRPDESFTLSRIREFPSHPGPVRLIAPSTRDKGFLVLDDSGVLGLYYSTSHRILWRGESPLDDATALFYTPKNDGALLAARGSLGRIDIHNPHPETSLGALFGKVWYEGYTKPEYVWQSTGGTDDFEPKLSLTPLMIGTLKGTIYSLFLAIPLGVLGAMYTSQFMHPSLKRYVKPTVEIMAALPSVVLGFLAGLWLAPRLEKVLPAMILMGLVVPLAVLLSGLAWRSLPTSIRGRWVAGSEVLIYSIVVALAVWLCLALGGAFEASVFGGSFPDWLLGTTGLRYDQRNAIVVGLAMGFAVIPIIFSIAEDAFSNVPRNLTAGSLALGANRWQTVTRVVLPTASPGIFSAVMIGFGRAVGETMIVLMATGNTPVLDWNPFNGFRTLSANIAVEIPEAPHGGTLYRTLFLAALILFLFTFVVNTVAELVRQRLRRRYAQL